jgi:hypothetical protein
MQKDTANNQIAPEDKESLIKSLLYKEGCWVDWGKACQKLQQGGVSPQEIFTETGLQNSQQNLVIVASQVYDSLVKSKAQEELLNYFRGPRSDVLYELRILNQEERLAGATLVKKKQLDVDGAKEVAKAIKHFSHLAQPPTGFTVQAGDAVAYQYWKRALQKKSLPDKARLIAEGLKFAQSVTAREQIEKLLIDVANAETISQPEPLLPIYRLESEYELPRILPVAGTFPLKVDQLQNIPLLSFEEPFGMTEIENPVKLVAIPNWQVILQAEKPVVIFCQSDDLPKKLSNRSELILVVVDLEAKEWNANNYFLVNNQGNYQFAWFADYPSTEILGKLLLILRPKKILDENNLSQPWQMDD